MAVQPVPLGRAAGSALSRIQPGPGGAGGSVPRPDDARNDGRSLPSPPKRWSSNRGVVRVFRPVFVVMPVRKPAACRAAITVVL